MAAEHVILVCLRLLDFGALFFCEKFEQRLSSPQHLLWLEVVQLLAKEGLLFFLFSTFLRLLVPHAWLLAALILVVLLHRRGIFILFELEGLLVIFWFLALIFLLLNLLLLRSLSFIRSFIQLSSQLSEEAFLLFLLRRLRLLGGLGSRLSRMRLGDLFPKSDLHELFEIEGLIVEHK